SAIVCGGGGLFRVKSVAVVKVRTTEIVGGDDWWCDAYGFSGVMVVHGAKKWWSWFICYGGGDWRCTGALQWSVCLDKRKKNNGKNVMLVKKIRKKCVNYNEGRMVICTVIGVLDGKGWGFYALPH
ncbi:hypothetical protein Tco_1289180, partial [Tanacetum coccineum]